MRRATLSPDRQHAGTATDCMAICRDPDIRLRRCRRHRAVVAIKLRRCSADQRSRPDAALRGISRRRSGDPHCAGHVVARRRGCSGQDRLERAVDQRNDQSQQCRADGAYGAGRKRRRDVGRCAVFDDRGVAVINSRLRMLIVIEPAH
jgi:hypothetical protein